MKLFRFALPVLAAAVAFAQPPANMPQPTFDNVKAYLGLTDNTIQTIQQAIQKQQAAIQTLAQQAQEKHKALADLLAKGTTDAAAVGKLVLDAEAIRKQIKTQHDALQSTVVSYLTADQKTKLAALEAAAKLRPAIEEAVRLHLIAAPEGVGPMGPGGPGGPGPRVGGPGSGPMGPGGPQGFGMGFMRRNR